MPQKPVSLTQIGINCVFIATLMHFSETTLCETVVLNSLYCVFVQNPIFGGHFGGHFEFQTYQCHYVDDMYFSCDQTNQVHCFLGNKCIKMPFQCILRKNAILAAILNMTHGNIIVK